MSGSMPMWSQSSSRNLRVGDAERDRATNALGRHYTEGRLDHEEFEERLTRACAAKTRGDLDALFVDLPPLPGPARVLAPVAPPARTRRRAPFLRVLAIVMLFLAVTTHEAVPLFIFVFLLPALAISGAASGARRVCRYVSDEVGPRLPNAPRY